MILCEEFFFDTNTSACVGEDGASMKPSFLAHVGQSPKVRSITGVPGEKETQIL